MQALDGRRSFLWRPRLERETALSLHDEIVKALAAHAEWKTRVGDAVARGTSEFTVADIAPDNLCVFGRWLYGDEITADEKATAGYDEVCHLHVRFHTEAARVLELALAGKGWEAAAAMGQGSAYAQASLDLLHALAAWHERAAA
ncbi:MAG: hypothetical protein EPO22_07840 [Dehalococcoidia bacterium]|nr:MAG: hypothetical protein EPO22_07840 [Dehalococcoidia bacterium]